MAHPPRATCATRWFIPTCVGQMQLMRMNRIHLSRFIPTCVGQMAGVAFLRGVENGSSPRAWGRSGANSPRCWSARFIPTCVGQMLSKTKKREFSTVHPHVRGADYAFTAADSSNGSVHPHVRGADGGERVMAYNYPYGSSPRAWGRCRLTVAVPFCACGSSPRAWGRFASITMALSVLSVHPHVRGADGGSRPRPADGQRFIPTCVGQMLSLPSMTPLNAGSSPRAWGRFFMYPTASSRIAGSSPRAWGRCA